MSTSCFLQGGFAIVELAAITAGAAAPANSSTSSTGTSGAVGLEKTNHAAHSTVTGGVVAVAAALVGFVALL